MKNAPSPPPESGRLLTFAGGGWVLLLCIILVTGVFIWAVAPAVIRATERPPGDGRNPETYGFDLSNLTVPRNTLAAGLLHRDMVPVVNEAAHLTVDEFRRMSEEERGKYLVSSDRIVGVAIDGEARAYPVSVLTVHEVINDELAGRPIAVTYCWLTDSPRVFDRRIGDDDVPTFGVSGLLSNANTLLYDRRPPPEDQEIPWEVRGESLWLQLTGEAVSGPAARHQQRLETIPAQLVTWRAWREMHPETTITARDSMMIKRYRRSSPAQYFRSADIPYPVDPLPGERWPGKKDRVVKIFVGEPPDRRSRVYPVRTVSERGEQIVRRGAVLHQWRDEMAGLEIRFEYEPEPDTVRIDVTGAQATNVDWLHAFWFAVHALDPDVELFRGE